MRLVSWNINGFVQKQPDKVAAQIDAVLHMGADVVCLQEVRAESLEAWTSALATRYPNLLTTHHLLGERRNLLLLATDFEIEPRPPESFEVPFPELVLSAHIVLSEVGSIELTETHVPNGSSNGWRKIQHLESLYRYLALSHRPDRPRILCGDFNCPRRELRDGTLVTWAQEENGRLRRDRGQRWDAGERAVVLGLKAFDLTDVYRDQEGYERVESEEGSWVARNRGREFPRRFDHVFASHQLRPWQFGFRHDLRKGGLSDHSAAIVDFGA